MRMKVILLVSFLLGLAMAAPIEPRDGKKVCKPKYRGTLLLEDKSESKMHGTKVYGAKYQPTVLKLEDNGPKQKVTFLECNTKALGDLASKKKDGVSYGYVSMEKGGMCLYHDTIYGQHKMPKLTTGLCRDDELNNGWSSSVDKESLFAFTMDADEEGHAGLWAVDEDGTILDQWRLATDKMGGILMTNKREGKGKEHWVRMTQLEILS